MTKVIEPGEVVEETPVEEAPKVEAPAEKTIGESFEAKEKETVPLATLLAMKSENKEAKAQIKELQQQIEDGASKVEISKGIKEIAKEHNVDETFLSEFASTIKAQAEKGIDDKITEKLKPFEEKGRAEKIDTIFNSNYDRVLESMPEYKDIVNKAVIKSLSLDPANKNKTFIKIIEESYGHLVTGKKTIESSSPAGSKEYGEKLDKSKFRDPAYMKKVLADPVLKKEYNEGLVERLGM